MRAALAPALAAEPRAGVTGLPRSRGLLSTCPDPVFKPVVDGPQVQVISFEGPEIAFLASEVLLGGDRGGGVEAAGRDAGVDDTDAVQRGLGADGGLVTVPGEMVSPTSRMRCSATS